MIFFEDRKYLRDVNFYFYSDYYNICKNDNRRVKRYVYERKF